MSAWIWIFIPVTAILVGAFKEWLKFQATQKQLGTSTRELEKDFAEMQKTNDLLLERVQNLEAIVVSQTWDALHDKGLAPAERELRAVSAARREFKPDVESANQQRAEQLARRLQG